MKIEAEEFDESVVTLDTYNSDLNLVIDASKYSANPLTNEGFAFMWAGARATHGASKGKFCFEVKILENIDVSHLPADEPNPHVVRVGVSVESSTLQLGEDPLSYGYGGTGKISTNCQFKDFGQSFQAGDVILSAVNMDSEMVQVGFAKNGKFLGWAYKINKNELKGQALFPHVLTKNVSFEVNFGQKEKPYLNLPDSLKDFAYIGCLPLEQRVSGSRPPRTRQDCEMLMMCGLPGAGKSVWAAEYSKKNPEKKFNLLGTNNIIDKMKVMGLPRKRNYHGRWDVLIQMATKCLNKMFEIGSKVRRNYILDQTNVYPTAQRRKMRNFEGFKRRAVVVVPSEAEYKRRCDKRDREEGKEVPDHAVLEMKANFKLPEVNDIFNDIIFTELPQEEAERLVAVYNDEGKSAVGPPRKQFKSNDQTSGYGNNRRFDSGRGAISNRGFSPRGGFENSRGGFDGGRGGFRGGRGEYDGNRGGFGENRGGFDGNREGFDGGRGGFDRNRGGFNGGRGGYDRGRGGYNGGYGGRGEYEGNRGGYEGSRGSYESGRGGYESSRGGYEGGRSGHDDAHGGHDDGRGGYEGSRGVHEDSRGGYEGGRGGYNRGAFDGGRGGYDRKRGFDDGGPQRFDRSQGAGSSPGGYSGGSQGNFGSYSSSSPSGFGSNSRGLGSRGGPRGRGDFSGGRPSSNQDSYSNRDSNFGNNSGQFSGSSYGHEPALGAYDKSDSSNGRGQRGFRGGASRDGNSRGGSNSSSRSYGGGSSVGASGSYSGGFNRDTSSNYTGGYSSYQGDYGEKSSETYGSDSNTYSRKETSSFGAGSQGGYIKKEPGIETAGFDSGIRAARGSTRPSGRTTRWSAEVPQLTTYPERTSTTSQDTNSYSSYGLSQVKSEPAETSYETYAPKSPSYTSYVPPSQPNQGYQGTQSYGYQATVPPNTASQSWTGIQASTAGAPIVPGAQDQQQQWSQYYQQQSQPSQYFNQYYGQQATDITPAYGSVYGAK